MTEPESLKKYITGLPNEPGIYKYIDKNEKIIYVGKAKNLKKRVSSYFTKSHTDNKTRNLVKQIFKIEYIIVNSETDALLLENNLIKTNQPKYNILLRDDKTYPYIVITNDIFPKIFATRRFNPGSGRYYGPFSSVRAMHSVMDLIKKLFTIRNCDLHITEQAVQKGKFKKCLEYHLGNCKAPCEGLQDYSDYIKDIDQAEILLKGDLSLIKKIYIDQIKEYTTSLEFEKAFKTKQKLDLLDKYQSTTLMSSTKDVNVLVFTIKEIKEKHYVNFFNISFGRIIQSKTLEAISLLDESQEDILSRSIVYVIEEYNLNIKEIIVNIEIENPIPNYHIYKPQIGDKKKLIDLSLKNIEYFINENNLKEKKEIPSLRILETLKKDLNLKELPTHIECFDNSNIQGTTPVAAMVCYKNGLPSKKDWRHYNIKTVVGPNDFDSMKEVIYRRYARLKQEELPMPNLIVIDGGKGQLSSAIDSLQKLGLYGSIPIISIAKKLEEIYMPEDEIPILLKKNTESLKLLQRIRNDTHRFGITFHRNKREKLPKK